LEDEVQNTGHADLVEDAKGNWWAVLLGVRPVRKEGEWEDSVLGMPTPSTFAITCLPNVIGRESFLVPVSWENDWPVINGGDKITLQSTGPGLYHHDTPVEWSDDFSGPSMQLGWYRKSE
jgi:beta-xylosidase